MCQGLPSETFWQLYTVGPPPLPASRESDLFPPSPQAACWRWNEILAAWGKLRSGRARLLRSISGRWWKEPETQPLLSAATPTPAASWELMGVSTAVKSIARARRPRPSPGGARAPVIGGWFATHTHVPLFGPDHVLCLHSSMWYHWKEIEPTLKVQKEQPSSAGKRWSRGREWNGEAGGRPDSLPGKDIRGGGQKTLMGKRDSRERSKWTLMMIIISCIWKSFLVDKAFSQLLSHLILTKTYDHKVPLLLENKEGGDGLMPLNPLTTNSLTFHEAQQGSSKRLMAKCVKKTACRPLFSLSFPLTLPPSFLPLPLSPALYPIFKLTKTIHTCVFKQIRNEWNIRMQKGNVLKYRFPK